MRVALVHAVLIVLAGFPGAVLSRQAAALNLFGAIKTSEPCGLYRRSPTMAG